MRSPHSRSTSLRRVIAAIEIDRADQRLADVGEDRRAHPSAGVGLRGAKPQRRAKVDGARDVGAGLAAHQVGEPARQFAFVGFREGAEQHVGDDQAEHMIAQKFQPLIAVGPIAAGQRRNVSQRAIQQSRSLKR